MLVILLTTTFLLLRVAPGDPVTATLGDRISPARAEAIRHSLGLDRPLWRQYVDYLGHVARGDFGRAITTNRAVSSTIADRFPATLELTLAALVVAVAVGVGIGALSARFRDTPMDVGGRILGILLYAAPIFWLGIMLQLLFAVKLGWFPTGGRIAPFSEPRSITGLYTVDALLTGNLGAFRSALGQLVLPALTLGFSVMAPLTRMVRATMLEVLESDYIKAAWAAGLPRRTVVYGDALRNCMIPVITLIGVVFGFLMAGNVVVEIVFAWPGIGNYAVTSLMSKDSGPIQSFVLFVAVVYVVVNLAVDLAYGFVDPRIRLR